MAEGVTELLNVLYNMVQDGFSLGRDKCVVNRARMLDLLSEINAELPSDIEQARKIVEAKNEIISAAKREAENLRRQAEERARALVAKDEITAAARVKAAELVNTAEQKSREVRLVANQYVDDALARAEEALSQALGEVKDSRGKFKAAAKQQPKPTAPAQDQQ